MVVENFPQDFQRQAHLFRSGAVDQSESERVFEKRPRSDVFNGAVGGDPVRDVPDGAVKRTQPGAAESDRFNRTGCVADHDPVAHFEGTVGDDRHGTEEVGNRVLGGEGDRQTGDTGAGDQRSHVERKEVFRNEDEGQNPDRDLDRPRDQIDQERVHLVAGTFGAFPEVEVEQSDDPEDSPEKGEDECGIEEFCQPVIQRPGKVDHVVAGGKPGDQNQKPQRGGQTVDDPGGKFPGKFPGAREQNPAHDPVDHQYDHRGYCQPDRH